MGYDDFADDDDFGDSDFLYGVSPIISALRSERRTFHQLWLQDTLSGDSKQTLREIERLAETHGIEILRRDKGTLNGMCRNRPHQGMVLRASPLSFESMQTLPKPYCA